MHRTKTIPDFPRYVVSEDGCVFRGARKLKPRLRRGYLVVDLYNNHPAGGSYKRTHYVHLLVMAAFGPSAPNGKNQVRHLDGNRTNATITNLAWGSQSDNEADKATHGTKTAGEKHPSAKLSTEDVANIRFDRRFWEMPVTALAERYGVSTRQIGRIVRGESRVAA